MSLWDRLRLFQILIECTDRVASATKDLFMFSRVNNQSFKFDDFQESKKRLLKSNGGGILWKEPGKLFKISSITWSMFLILVFSFSFLKGANPGLFFIYFCLFKQTIQFLQQINVKMASQYSALGFELTTFWSESLPLTTRPGLLPIFSFC